ncbi:MAG: ROK family protein [bacterium]|nr:ROK family protein [bacterium]
MILAIDVGGTKYSLALATGRGEIVKRVVRATDREGGATWMVSRILEAGHELIAGSPERVRACGIGFGGPVDFGAQRIVNSTHVPGWDGVPLPEIVEEKLGVPAVVDNDANVGGLGEFTFGAGRGGRNIVYYTVSTGIGGGIVLDGRIYRGSNGNAGELGHVPILLDGPPCDCGNRGCLEALCSGPAIARRAEEAVRAHPRRGRSLVAAGKGILTAKVVFDAARKGDRLALEIVEETCVYLGMGLATTMNAFAPDVIVVGGGVCKAGRVLFDPLRRQTDRFLMPVHRPHLKIVPAQRKDRSVLLGAVALAKQLEN